MEKEERENSLSFCNSEKFLSNGSNRSILGTFDRRKKRRRRSVCVCVCVCIQILDSLKSVNVM